MIKKILFFFIKKIHKIAKAAMEQENQAKSKKIESDILNFKLTVDPSSSIDYTKIQNPFNDKSKIRVGKESQVKADLEVFHLKSTIIIGDYCYLGPGTRVCCSKSISIGNRVLISHNVNIYDNNSHPLNAKERHDDFVFIIKNGYQQELDLKASSVIIEDDVWIGFNSIILKGVTIGRGAIIGAGTLIVKDVPAFAMVVGNPAKIIRYTN